MSEAFDPFSFEDEEEVFLGDQYDEQDQLNNVNLSAIALDDSHQSNDIRPFDSPYNKNNSDGSSQLVATRRERNASHQHQLQNNTSTSSNNVSVLSMSHSNTSGNGGMESGSLSKTRGRGREQERSRSHSRSRSNLLYTPTTLDKSGTINTTIDSDIFSTLFQIGGNEPATKSQPNLIQDVSDKSQVSDVEDTEERVRIPVHLALHEQMSCIYSDSVPHGTEKGRGNNATTMEIHGSLDVIPAEDIEGRSFYLAINDPDNHIGTLTSDDQIVKDITDSTNTGIEDEFVLIRQKQGCRVFQVDLPGPSDSIDSKSINLIKFVGSEFLRPIPLLVNVKTRVAGTYCRVGLKIRSNPTNNHYTKNVILLMAVPPDVSGESMKMSKNGGIWDPMKRVIIYRCEKLDPGETLEIQMQFEYLAASRENQDMPRFPVLVRCHGMKDLLSNIRIEVGGGDDVDDNIDRDDLDSSDLAVKPDYELNLEKSYKLFHRKV